MVGSFGGGLKKLDRSRPEGRRKVGRPRRRLLEEVEKDLRKIGVRNWRRKALDRENRKVTIKEVTTLQGPKTILSILSAINLEYRPNRFISRTSMHYIQYVH
ncbi:hypothetical protein O3M35_007653 [Rhynocoris fuscipes]|uniref:Uncharacterized protein n=1 Tax=Rhynocoris fuscipes TaxID=488301 RepID=A0AAW1DBR2_9HEMI